MAASLSWAVSWLTTRLTDWLTFGLDTVSLSVNWFTTWCTDWLTSGLDTFTLGTCLGGAMDWIRGATMEMTLGGAMACAIGPFMASLMVGLLVPPTRNTDMGWIMGVGMASLGAGFLEPPTRNVEWDLAFSLQREWCFIFPFLDTCEDDLRSGIILITVEVSLMALVPGMGRYGGSGASRSQLHSVPLVLRLLLLLLLGWGLGGEVHGQEGGSSSFTGL